MKKSQEIKLNKQFSNDYVIYTRKSTDDAENQKNSIGYQTNENKRYSEKESLPVARFSLKGFCTNGIIEEHHSGFKQDDDFVTNGNGTITYKVLRPKFLTLVNLLRQKEFKGVICLCWDRFSRNEADDVLIKRLMSQGIDVRFVQANYEDSSAGALHMDIDGMFSRHYSRVISEKVKDSSRKLRAEGKCIYTAPMGYLNHGSDHKPFDPIRAPLVKRLFELYATGDWSYSSLSEWANTQGLTTRPVRRKRTLEERAAGIPLESIPQVARAITPKTIENTLRNPFYTGRLVNKGEVLRSQAHDALIDTGLFYQVQALLKQKTTSAYYSSPLYFAYRGLVRCRHCQRVYTPYAQKKGVYYRSKCKANCPNADINTNEQFITNGIYTTLKKISFSETELQQMESDGQAQLDQITIKRDAHMNDLYRRLNKAMADLDYLTKDKLNLLRTGVFTPDQMKDEESRLTGVIEDVQLHIRANSESTKAMLDYVVLFSDLVKGWAEYFKSGLDTDKRYLAKEVFSELWIENGTLKYTAKQGYGELLKRFDASNLEFGSPDYVFSELLNIYTAVKASMPGLQTAMSITPKQNNGKKTNGIDA